jgi:hyperosmotically inducible periplasmic protein
MMNPAHTALITAGVLIALTAGCKREESAPTAPTPQTAPQSAPSPTTSPGTTSTDPGRTVGQTVDDATITAKVKAELAKADDVKAMDINVDTVSGAVTLKGAVDSKAQADRAETIAKGVEGVRSVQNTLTVKAGK